MARVGVRDARICGRKFSIAAAASSLGFGAWGGVPKRDTLDEGSEDPLRTGAEEEESFNSEAFGRACETEAGLAGLESALAISTDLPGPKRVPVGRAVC